MVEYVTKVLIVEDDPADARAVEAVLRDVRGSRFDLTVARNLGEALQQLDGEAFELVLLDLWLPESSGLDTLLAVRRQCPEVPVVVITGVDDESLAVSAVREGAGDYLVKGRLHGPMLARVMRYAVERRRAEQERHRLESQIQHAQKLESLGVLAGGIAHDFNNLLMGILGHASLALMELAPGQPARHNAEQIETAALRAAELTKQLLAYSGKGKFVMQSLNLSRLVEEMSQLLDTVISRKAVLKLHFAVDLPEIEGDSAQIRQVVMNLITNAADAIHGLDGVITLSTDVVEVDAPILADAVTGRDLPEGPYVLLRVTDTGRGMDEKTMARMFDPFFTTKLTGRGLGLAAVLGIVRAHGGAIKVESEPGTGTTFRVLFPLDGTRALQADHRQLELFPHAPQTVRPEAGISWRGSGTILVVDDDEPVRSVAREMLEKMGFEVLTACDGYEALAAARHEGDKIDAVLLDVTMPHMGGEQTFRELQRARPDLPVILSSGYDEQEAARRFAGQGLAGFIQKPYRPNALAERVRRALDGQPSIGQLAQD